jgi:hypothetical protein
MSAARPGTLHAVPASMMRVVNSAAAGVVLIAGSLAFLTACGSSGIEAGSDASVTSGCAAGETYCSSCAGGGFCSVSCPAVACPVRDSGLTDAAGSSDGGACPASAPSSCPDCNGGWFCVSGACPATTCPRAPEDAGADAVGFALTSLDEPCEGGPTGRQLLMYVEATYKGTYDPPPSHPDAGPSALTITASYDGGAIECIPAPAFSCCAGCPCRTPPPPSVTVDLDVGFKIADGTLDESVTATATFSPDVYEVPWTAVVPKAAIKGSYPFAAGSIDLAFNGIFRSAMSSGSLAEDSPPAPGSSTLSGGTWTATAVDGGTD